MENNPVLQGIYMSPERAQWMSEITEYVEGAGLEGREVLLYGKIPALAYYLNMPPAFNCWMDLSTYSLSAMKEDMAELEAEIEAGSQMPVVIFEQKFSDYENMAKEDPKLELIRSFMDKYEYGLTFRNDKFLVLEAREEN